MHTILNKQNEPEMIRLLQAASAAYTRAKYFEVIFLRLMFLMAVCVPVIYLYLRTGTAKLILGLFAFGLTIFIQLISVFVKSHVIRGALYKEKFDTELFALPWKSTVARPDLLEVERFALSRKKHQPLNWYPVELSEQLPNGICIAACQRINAEWDIWIRQAFKRFLSILLGIYSVLLLTSILYFNPDGLNIFPMLFSSLSLYIYYINQIRGHNAIIETRKNISMLIDQFVLLNHSVPDERTLRDIQDEILHTRKQPILVPDFFYRFNHKQMQRATIPFVEEINQKWAN